MVVGCGCSTKTTSDTRALDLSYELRVCARTRASWGCGAGGAREEYVGVYLQGWALDWGC